MHEQDEPDKRQAKPAQHIRNVVHAQIDTADAHRKDDARKCNLDGGAERKATHATPYQPYAMAIKRHGRHRVARGEAQPRRLYKPKSLWTRSTHKDL